MYKKHKKCQFFVQKYKQFIFSKHASTLMHVLLHRSTRTLCRFCINSKDQMLFFWTGKKRFFGKKLEKNIVMSASNMTGETSVFIDRSAGPINCSEVKDSLIVYKSSNPNPPPTVFPPRSPHVMGKY